jgi:glycosyltransferase involved in cell wall biosynthesis
VLTARRLPSAALYWLHGYEQAAAVWLRRTPYVYDAHDFYVALPYDGRRLNWRERATHAVREAIERACVRRAAACVTTSATMARLYEQRFGRPFAVVRNAQDARLSQPAVGDVRNAAGLGPDDVLVVMVGNAKAGTIVPERLPERVHVAVVGAGYGSEALERLHFVGPVPPQQVASFIATADAAALFYVPVSENSRAQLVNGLFHAVAAGLPLLYPARMEAIRELCEEHRLGVPFEPSDPDSFAESLAGLRRDRERLRASVLAAQDKLGWEREERVLARVLDEALAAGRAA